MKDFMTTMMKDIQKDDFTTKECVVFGVIAPAAFIAVVVLASVLNF